MEENQKPNPTESECMVYYQPPELEPGLFSASGKKGARYLPQVNPRASCPLGEGHPQKNGAR